MVYLYKSTFFSDENYYENLYNYVIFESNNLINQVINKNFK